MKTGQCVFLTICALAFAAAQDREPQFPVHTTLARAYVPDHGPAIRLDVKRVLIPVTVTDLLDRPVTGMAKNQFRVYEDGIEQRISDVANEDAPISVGVLFDVSGSMERKLERSKQAVRDFVSLSTPGDEFFLTVFSEFAQPVFGFTADPRRIEDGLATLRADGATALFDALYLATHQMRVASNPRKVLLVLSDGNDNSSRYNLREVKRLLREADVRIFAISIQDRSRALEEIADESGGRAYRIQTLDELPEITARLSAESHSQYVLSYTPVNASNDGKYRRVRVVVTPPQGTPVLRTSWRRGYYGPSR